MAEETRREGARLAASRVRLNSGCLGAFSEKSVVSMLTTLDVSPSLEIIWKMGDCQVATTTSAFFEPSIDKSTSASF